MKATEVPEKIYIQPSVIEQLTHQNIVYTKPLADNSIEYTRTDAFLAKAVEWLKENVTYIHPRKGKEECVINLARFKEYMKRE